MTIRCLSSKTFGIDGEDAAVAVRDELMGIEDMVK